MLHAVVPQSHPTYSARRRKVSRARFEAPVNSGSPNIERPQPASNRAPFPQIRRLGLCKALKKSPHTIGSYFNEWKKVNPRSAVVKQHSSEMESSTSHSPTKNERSMANYPISDEDIQYSVAKTLATEHYYKKTWIIGLAMA